jgi:hypothetical protein
MAYFSQNNSLCPGLDYVRSCSVDKRKGKQDYKVPRNVNIYVERRVIPESLYSDLLDKIQLHYYSKVLRENAVNNFT